MDLSGVIFVVLAVAWAVFLIPKALQHHDQVARTRSVDRFSGALRVLARREPVSKTDARLVVNSTTRVRSRVVETEVTETLVEAPVELAADSAVETAPALSPAQLRARRQAARVAARRRRRILSVLLLATVATTTAAAVAAVPWWSVAIPGGLTLVWLVLCRTQVRSESRVAVRRPAAAAATQPEQAVDAPVHVEEVAPDRVADFDDEREDTIGIPVALLDVVAIPTEDGGTLWDPLPVTLPTYVTKPRAKRTVRTIDLGEPGTWTSGRTAEDAQIAADADAAQADARQDDQGTDGARAVGS